MVAELLVDKLVAFNPSRVDRLLLTLCFQVEGLKTSPSSTGPDAERYDF